MGNLHDYRGGQLQEQYLFVMKSDYGALVFNEEVLGVAYDFRGNHHLLIGVVIHEDKISTILVQVGHIPAINRCGLDFYPGIKGTINRFAT